MMATTLVPGARACPASPASASSIRSTSASIATRYRALFCGYSFAWVGHFFFEKNRPATFQHPLYSFMGDWVMFADILRGRMPW